MQGNPIIEEKALLVAASDSNQREGQARRIRRSASRLEAAFLTASQIDIQSRVGADENIKRAMVDLRNRIIRQEQEDGIEDPYLAWALMRCGVSAGRLLSVDPELLVESCGQGRVPFASVHRMHQLQRVASDLACGRTIHQVHLPPEGREGAAKVAARAGEILDQVTSTYRMLRAMEEELDVVASLTTEEVLEALEPLQDLPAWLVRTLTR